MPFKPSRFVLASLCTCGCEKQIIKGKDGSYSYVNFNPCVNNMSEPAATRLGVLLESGVQLNTVNTTLFETRYHHNNVADDNNSDNSKKEG